MALRVRLGAPGALVPRRVRGSVASRRVLAARSRPSRAVASTAEGAAPGAREPHAAAVAFWRWGRWFHERWLGQASEGLERLPAARGAFLLASNHSSHLDCSALYVAAWAGGVRTVVALGAKDYFFSNAFKRWFVTTFMGVLPISREGVRGQEVELVRNALARATPERPAAAVIFPEGTRSVSGRVNRFKTGCGFLALKLGVPVVPACVEGTHAAMPKGRPLPWRRRTRVRFGEPLDPSEYVARHERALGPAADAREIRDTQRAALREFAADLHASVVGLQDEMRGERGAEPEWDAAGLPGGVVAVVFTLVVAALRALVDTVDAVCRVPRRVAEAVRRAVSPPPAAAARSAAASQPAVGGPVPQH